MANKEFNPELAAAAAREPFDTALAEDKEELTARQRVYLRKRAETVAARASQTEALTVRDEGQIALLRKSIQEGPRVEDDRNEWLEQLKTDAVLDKKTEETMLAYNKLATPTLYEKIVRKRQVWHSSYKFDVALAKSLFNAIATGLIDSKYEAKKSTDEVGAVTQKINSGVEDEPEWEYKAALRRKRKDPYRGNTAPFKDIGYLMTLSDDDPFKATDEYIIGRLITEISLYGNQYENNYRLVRMLKSVLTPEEIADIFNKVEYPAGIPEILKTQLLGLNIGYSEINSFSVVHIDS